jgi:hypothetical protein
MNNIIYNYSVFFFLGGSGYQIGGFIDVFGIMNSSTILTPKDV